MRISHLGLVERVLCMLSGLKHLLMLLHKVVQAVDSCNSITTLQLPLLQAQI